MNELGVVTVDLVFGGNLPVGVQAVLHPAGAYFDTALGRQPVEHVYHARAFAQVGLQRLTLRRKTGEHKTAVRVYARHTHHAMARTVEIVAITLGKRNADERAVHTERPSVVRAGDRLGMALFDLADPVAAVRAAVVQHIAGAACVACQNHRLQADHSGNEITMGRHLALMADINPAAAKDAVEFVFKHLGLV